MKVVDARPLLIWRQKLAKKRNLLLGIPTIKTVEDKEVTVYLTPPLSDLRFVSTELAPKEEKGKFPRLAIYPACDLAAYCGDSSHIAARVRTAFSSREYALQYPVLDALTAQVSAMLHELPAPGLLAAGAVYATTQAL